MSPARELYLQKLKAANASHTHARTAVFEALLTSEHEPLVMKELITKVSPAVDRASVYRSVELLERIGIIKRLHIGWKYKLELSDDFHGHHHHLSCERCGATVAIDDNAVFEKQIQSIAASHGYTVTDHQLDIPGICINCAKIK